MLKYLHKFLEDSRFQFYILHFCPDQAVEVIATDGYLMCSIGIRATHRLDGIVMGVEIPELDKIKLLSAHGVPHFKLESGQLFITSAGIEMSMNVIPTDKVPDVKNIIDMPATDEENETTFFVSNLKTVTEFCDYIDDSMFHQKFCGMNKPIVYYGEEKDWKIYMMPVEYSK